MGNFRLDPKGLEELLKSKEIVVAVENAANAIAGNVDLGSVTEARIDVRSSITDDMKMNRARSAVTIAHPAGLSMEAKHGTLRKAAASAGLEIKAKK